ncbi:MAG: M16 family metallopeptidase, partial [Acidimicrobiales bacterium]
YIRLLAADVELALDILSDILWSPSFRGEEVEAERQVILEEILMHGDEPTDLIHDVFASALFPAHPLGREVLGKEATVRDLGRDRIAAFHADHYRPVNVVFAAAGNVDHDRMVDGIRARAGEVNGGQAPGRVAPSAGDRRRRFVVESDTEQAHLIVGVPGPARDDDDRHALTVIDHVLGGGMSSRLFQTIREERGLAYSVYSFRLLFQDAGSVGVYAGTSPANASEVLDLMKAGIERMATDGVTDAELAAARSHLRGSLALGLEDSGARWSRIGHSQLIHGRVPALDELEARMAELTVDRVNEVAHRYLAQPVTLAAVGPFGDGELPA